MMPLFRNICILLTLLIPFWVKADINLEFSSFHKKMYERCVDLDANRTLFECTYEVFSLSHELPINQYIETRRVKDIHAYSEYKSLLSYVLFEIYAFFPPTGINREILLYNLKLDLIQLAKNKDISISFTKEWKIIKKNDNRFMINSIKEYQKSCNVYGPEYQLVITAFDKNSKNYTSLFLRSDVCD